MDTLLQNKNRSFENGYVSVNSKPEYPPPPHSEQTPDEFFERANSLPRAQRKCEISIPGSEKSC